MFKCCAISVAVLAIVMGGLLPLTDNLDRFRGVFPASHWGKPWRFTADQIPDLTGRTYLVTGANVGLGYWTVRHLAENNAKVYMACRDMKKCVDARKEIEADIQNAELKMVKLDLETGYESQFGVNHLGHFHLTNLLLPYMLDDSTITVVSSSANFKPKDFPQTIAEFNNEEKYNK
eukprot:UN31254